MTIGVISGRPADAMLECLAAVSIARLPPPVTDRALLCLLDTIGCGLNGSQHEWGRIMRAMVRQPDGPGAASVFGATVFGARERVSATQAALANGTMVHGFELDDVILGSLAHAGTVVVPAVLAVAEENGASVERMILGLIAGYEVIARLGAALGHHCAEAGFHPTGVIGPAAAAAASCVVLGLNPERMIDAVGIAASCGAGLKAFTQGTGGMVKRLHGGRGAEAGVLAMQLAQRGFTGPRRALDGKFGLLEVFSQGHARAQLLCADIGETWAIQRTWTKVWPCCGVLHTAVQALEFLRQAERLRPEDVKGVAIGTSRRGVEQNGDPSPREAMAAQYSLPFCAALALTGDARDPDSYADANLHRADVADLIPRISLRVDPDIDAAYPAKFAARVDVELHDGNVRSATVWDAHGMPADPCSADEIKTKFRRLAAPVLGNRGSAATLAAVEALATPEGSIARLGQTFRADAARELVA